MQGKKGSKVIEGQCSVCERWMRLATQKIPRCHTCYEKVRWERDVEKYEARMLKHRGRSLEWYQENKEYQKQRMKEYYHQNKEEIAEKKRKKRISEGKKPRRPKAKPLVIYVDKDDECTCPICKRVGIHSLCEMVREARENLQTRAT